MAALWGVGDQVLQSHISKIMAPGSSNSASSTIFLVHLVFFVPLVYLVSFVFLIQRYLIRLRPCRAWSPITPIRRCVRGTHPTGMVKLFITFVLVNTVEILGSLMAWKRYCVYALFISSRLKTGSWKLKVQSWKLPPTLRLRRAGKAQRKSIMLDWIFESKSYLQNFHGLCSWHAFGNIV